MRTQTALFITSMCFGVLMSCSELDESLQKEPDAITFEAYSSRGSITTGVTLSDGFGVFGAYTGESDFASSENFVSFMNNQKISRIEDAWTYSPVKYWPVEDDAKISFFAYGPYDKSISVDYLSTSPTLSFSLENSACNMKDLVCARVIDQMHPATATPILFRFSHVLAKLVFSAKVDIPSDPGALAKVNNVTIASIGSDGLPGSGLLDLINNTWAYPTSEPFSCSAGSGGLRDISIGSVVTNISSPEGGFMVFPTESNFKVIVTCELSLSGGETREIEVESTANVSFSQGHGYTIVLIIGDGTLSLTDEYGSML